LSIFCIYLCILVHILTLFAYSHHIYHKLSAFLSLGLKYIIYRQKISNIMITGSSTTLFITLQVYQMHQHQRELYLVSWAFKHQAISHRKLPEKLLFERNWKKVNGLGPTVATHHQKFESTISQWTKQQIEKSPWSM